MIKESNETELIGNILQEEDNENAGVAEKNVTVVNPARKLSFGPDMLKRADSAPPQDMELKFGTESPSVKKRGFDVGSYEYYQYYNSLKPKDPRLPKPTYKAYGTTLWKLNLTPGKLPVQKIDEERNENDDREKNGEDPYFQKLSGSKLFHEEGNINGMDTLQQKIAALNIAPGESPAYIQKQMSGHFGILPQDTSSPAAFMNQIKKYQGSQKNLTSPVNNNAWGFTQHSSNFDNAYAQSPQQYVGMGMPNSNIFMQSPSHMMTPSPMSKEGSFNNMQMYPGNMMGQRQVTMPNQGYMNNGYQQQQQMKPSYNVFQPQMNYQTPQYNANPWQNPSMNAMSPGGQAFYHPLPMQQTQMTYDYSMQNQQYPGMGGLMPAQVPMMGGGGMMVRQDNGFMSQSTHLAVQQQPAKTPFLENLRQKMMSNKKVELKELEGHVVESALDQHGSRLLQQRFEIASKDEKQMIFTELLPESIKLIVDVFGNYVMQKLLEHGTDEMRNSVADQLLGHMYMLSTHMYGCRVVQKALEYASLDVKKLLAMELKDHIIVCIEDQNANHVIQKCIEKIPCESIQFIVDSVKNSAYQMCIHAYGCRVIQRLLEFCTEMQMQPLIEQILTRIVTLAKDQYGNYVIQHILEHGKTNEKHMIIDSLRGKVLEMGLQKFASNVIEKGLYYATPSQREELVDEIGGLSSQSEIVLFGLIKDRYGNFVVQKALEFAGPEQRNQLIKKIEYHSATIMKFGNYARHVFSYIEKLQGSRM